MHRLIFGFFGRLADTFYRWELLGGEVPADGPLILVANHPNGLVDPLMVDRVAGRRFRMLAKAPIFSVPVLGWMAKQVGAIPVYRKLDGDDTRQNRDAFAAAHQALAEGQVLFLFPEGISHNEPQLQPLKSGAARIALGAEAARGYGLGLRIVPVGITYRDKTRFGSAAAIEIGAPIDVAAFAEDYQRDPWPAVEALTAAIEDGVRRLTINLDRWEDLPLVRLAEKILGRRDAHVVKRLRAMAATGRARQQEDPEAFAALRQRLAAFQLQLDELGLEVNHLDARYSPAAVVRFVLRNLLAVVIGLPLAVAAGLLYLPPRLLVRSAGRRWSESEDVLVSVKFLAGALLFPLWHAGIVLTAWTSFGGPWAALLGVLLPFAYLYSRYFFLHRVRALREIRAFLAAPFQRERRRRLRQLRDELSAVLWGLRLS
ncbi:MAG: 1-acyl-sn-glycerol-3-phosphate acyltransferase [Planctomycetes bacterium]|nr:1-acyl-sn-glycerol-3-phosphate acyltransferase [Planctomycetota bacterium]